MDLLLPLATNALGLFQLRVEDLCDEVLKRGAHFDDEDESTGMSLIHYASKAGVRIMGDDHTAAKVVRQLISKGASVNQRSSVTDMTPLHYAAYFGCTEVPSEFCGSFVHSGVACVCYPTIDTTLPLTRFVD